MKYRPSLLAQTAALCALGMLHAQRLHALVQKRRAILLPLFRRGPKRRLRQPRIPQGAVRESPLVMQRVEFVQCVHLRLTARHDETRQVGLAAWELGFSYHDLMARLKTNGPDDAWKRLREILGWFREVQAEGGYRAYYAKPGRGKLQGGGPPGGLGVDQEFIESGLIPQIMLHGFLGFTANADGYKIQPRLPKDWPSLTINGIRFHDQVLNVTAHADGRVEVRDQATASTQDESESNQR